MGKLLRVGVDTTVNYLLEETGDYNEVNPAATNGAWLPQDDMDQSFSVSLATAVTHVGQGALVNFQRMALFNDGVKVKIKPTYDQSAGEDPYFEVWTHDEVSTVWTRRRKIQLKNLFVGVESGQAKIFDLPFGVGLANVDNIWITMNPGAVGTPTMDFLAIQIFGRCSATIVTPGECDDDPTTDNAPCKKPKPVPLPIPKTCADFDLEEDEDGNCIFPKRDFPRLPPPEEIPTREWKPPEFPAIDLCDAAEIAAFKDTLTPEQLAYFEVLLEASDLPCLEDPEDEDEPKQPQQELPINKDETGDPILPKQPIEEYIDPNTLEPETDPRNPDGDSGIRLRKTFRTVLTWSGNDTAAAQAYSDGNIALPPNNEDTAPIVELTGNWGPNAGVSTAGMQFTPACYGLKLSFGGLPYACRIGIRVRTFKLRGSASLRDSISTPNGSSSTVASGFCPVQPDWILTPGDTLSIPTSNKIGEGFYEYAHTGGSFFDSFTDETTAELVLLLPREDAAQNDACTCTLGFKARSRLGFQRAGCILGFNVNMRKRWLYDVSTEDYDASSVFDYIHRSPQALVVDVVIRSSLVGTGVSVDVRNATFTLDMTTYKDAQPVDNCSVGCT